MDIISKGGIENGIKKWEFWEDKRLLIQRGKLSMKTKSVSKRLFAFLLSVAVIVGLFSNIALADTAIMQDSVEMQNEFKEDLTTESNLKVNREYAEDVSSWSRNLSNEYIECAINHHSGRFTIGTTGGNPFVNSDNNKKLTYGHPGSDTSYTTIFTDGIPNIYGESGFVTAPHISGKSNISVARYGDIEVKQILSIVKNTATGREDVIEIKYTAKNNSSIAKQVGVRVMLDTMLGSNDAAPFRISNIGEVTTEREFIGNDIPRYFQAFDSLSSPNVVSYGNFLSGSIRPDKVQFVNWGRISGKYWDYKIVEGQSNGDSAVSVIWDRKIPAGKEETYITRYGLSELAQDLRPPLETTLSGDSEVSIDNEKMEYAPYPLTIYIQNIGKADAKNVTVDIELPEGLKVKGEENLQTKFPEIKVGQIKEINKQIIVRGNLSKDEILKIKVRIKAENVEEKIITKDIKIPKLPRKAIIVLPGIVASRLYKNVNNKREKMLWEPNLFNYSNNIPFLACDENGNSINKVIPEHSSIDNNGNRLVEKVEAVSQEYGAKDTYGKLVKSLYNEFGKQYDVYFYSYDWRKSNSENAELLETFINEKEYKKINFVAHSMGGLIASEFLRRNNENINKVEKLITLGTPYLGAPKALYTLETGNFFDNLILDLVLKGPFQSVVNNFCSVYELLPTDKYFSLNNTTYVRRADVDTSYHQPRLYYKAIRRKMDYNETYNLISERAWAKNLMSKTLKSMLPSSKRFHNGIFNGRHITDYVDLYAIIGYGKNTLMQIEEAYKDGKYDKTLDITTLNGGDGTVPVISATIGNTINRNRDFFINEEHAKLAENKDVIEFVINILNNTKSHSINISDELPLKINKKGWLFNRQTYIKLKIECPVSLSMTDLHGDVWAEVSNETTYNKNSERGDFYSLGKDNDIKIAYLHQQDNNVLLTGTDNGVMKYTASIFDSGYETNRVVFRNVPITKTTKIYTDTDFNGGLNLKVDEDSDGNIDRIIKPSAIYEGKDLEEELDYDSSYFSNYGLVSKNRLLSTNLASKNLTVDTNISSDGLLSVLSSNFNGNGIFNAKTYLKNAIKQKTDNINLEENLETRLAGYIKEAIPVTEFKNIENHTIIGNTCYVKHKNFMLDKSLNVRKHLRYNTREFATKKPVILTSEKGDISIIANKKFDFNGIIYAPNGTVTITGYDVKFNGIIIADKIFITGTNTDITNTIDLSKLER